MTSAPPILQLLLLVALGFFLGLAFEEFHARSNQKRPGGIRTFPLLALLGALLYRLDPTISSPSASGCWHWAGG